VIPKTKPFKPSLFVESRNKDIYIQCLYPFGDGGDPITGHKIFGWSKTLNDFKPLESPNLLGPEAGNNYRYPTEKYLQEFGFSIGDSTKFKVIAINSIGESELSDQSDHKLILPPGTPRSIRLEMYGRDEFGGHLECKDNRDLCKTIKIEWPVPESNGGSEITGYHVYQQESPNQMLVFSTPYPTWCTYIPEVFRCLIPI